MIPDIDLTHIVNSSILQTFPDAFYKATGFACGIHNLAGDLMTTIPRSNYCPFCRNMYFSSQGHKKCLFSNIKGDKRAYLSSEPYIYRCHAGLVDVSAPIIVNGEHFGSITFGQLIISKLDDKLRGEVRRKIADFPKPFQEKQLLALEKVPVVSLKQVKGLAQLLSLIANNIVTLIISNLEEKALNVENTKIIDEIKANLTLEKKFRKAQLKLREMELKMLQAQINPHFLYNTLDSIKWLAVLHGADDIRHMTVALGSLLRYSLDREQDNVSVRKELETVESYLIIQKYRYGDKLSFAIQVDEGVLDFCIPKLLFQPLVENAILHGLEPQSTKGNVFIRGWPEGDGSAVIEIADDGMGMTPDTYQRVNASLNSQHQKQGERLQEDMPGRVGLANVNKRLMYRFGEASKLQIKSCANEGTVIRFRIGRQG